MGYFIRECHGDIYPLGVFTDGTFAGDPISFSGEVGAFDGAGESHAEPFDDTCVAFEPCLDIIVTSSALFVLVVTFRCTAPRVELHLDLFAVVVVSDLNFGVGDEVVIELEADIVEAGFGDGEGAVRCVVIVDEARSGLADGGDDLQRRHEVGVCIGVRVTVRVGISVGVGFDVAGRVVVGVFAASKPHEGKRQSEEDQVDFTGHHGLHLCPVLRIRSAGCCPASLREVAATMATDRNIRTKKVPLISVCGQSRISLLFSKERFYKY